jgi:hypothetical protein
MPQRRLAAVAAAVVAVGAVVALRLLVETMTVPVIVGWMAQK